MIDNVRSDDRVFGRFPFGENRRTSQDKARPVSRFKERLFLREEGSEDSRENVAAAAFGERGRTLRYERRPVRIDNDARIAL